MNSRRRIATSLFLVLAGVSFSSARDQAKEGPQSQPSTVLKTTTRLVVVDVVATNSKGEPVSGLGIHDFKLLENGKEQQIRVFDFQQPGHSPSLAQSQPPAKLSANMFSNAPTYKRGSAFNIILVDLLNTAIPRQAFTCDEVMRFLEKFSPDGPVAIYLLSGDLHLLQDFTDDPQVFRSAALRLNTKGSVLLDNKIGGPPVSVPLPSGTPPQMAASIRGQEQQARDFTTGEQIQFTLAALNSLAQRLAPYPGRKNLVWISDGFPFYVNPCSTSEAISRRYGRQVSEADNVLMDSQVAIYPVDAHALQVISYYDIGIGLPTGTPLTAMSNDFNERLAVHTTMNDLADQTGGEAFYNKNSIELALRKSIADGSTYYTLGYYPQDKNWDGKFRRIEVNAARPGIKLRHRLGYYALEPGALSGRTPEQREVALHQALDVNSPISSALQFRAMVISPSDKTTNKLLVNFGIDPRAISFERGPDGLEHATVECAVEAYSEHGKIKSEATTVNAALQPEAFARVQQTFFPCQQALDLKAGTYRLRLGVVDHHTGLLGTANATATVPETTASVSAPK